MSEITTKHNLPFEIAKRKDPLFGEDEILYRVGTCHGQWFTLDDCYVILSVMNEVPGNGHLDDVLEWFEHSCKRDGKNLLVLHCFNPGFYRHLIEKRGFSKLDDEQEHCIKVFDRTKYRRMIRKGNEIFEPFTFLIK